MDKEQNQNSEEVEINNTQETSLEEEVNKDKKKDPEERILELEDKLARAFAEMENQRRRFEKEKIEAFEFLEL